MVVAGTPGTNFRFVPCVLQICMLDESNAACLESQGFEGLNAQRELAANCKNAHCLKSKPIRRILKRLKWNLYPVFGIWPITHNGHLSLHFVRMPENRFMKCEAQRFSSQNKDP